jgi:glutamate racemase
MADIFDHDRLIGAASARLIGNVGAPPGVESNHIGASGQIFAGCFLIVFDSSPARWGDRFVECCSSAGVLLMPPGTPGVAGPRCGAIAGVVAAPTSRGRTRACNFEGKRQPISDAVSSALAPVGIFDSGVGGLTVARAIIDQLPDEDIIYVGDTANGPYGPLTIPEIRAHALAIGDDLVERGVKALVIACNTASSACLRDARERYAPVPVIEVILPAVRRAVAATRNGRIGVIGTTATIASGAYQDAFAAARDTEVIGVACPRFVDFVERGVTSGRQVLGLAEGYLEPLQRAEVDTLVLGCTHYPMLSGLIQLAMGDHVTLVSSAEETAKDLLRVLTELDLLRPHDAPQARRVFESTGDPEAFTTLAARFLGPTLDGVRPVQRHVAART